MGNPAVNGVILGILVAGIAYIFRQVLLLEPEIDWIESFRQPQAGGEEPMAGRRPAPRLLAPMARMLGARQAGGSACRRVRCKPCSTASARASTRPARPRAI